MHFTALLTLAAAFLPAVTPVPAPSPQSAEIDVHLELTSKDVADFFNDHKAETDPHHNADASPGQTLTYPFHLRGHLIQGLEIIGPQPPLPFYQFPKPHLGEQGILSRHPTIFRLRGGKLLIGDKAVGLRGRIEKVPVPAVLAHPQQGLNFTAAPLIGSKITTLRFSDQRLTFLGPKFVSGVGDHVEVGLRPRELNPQHLFPLLFLLSSIRGEIKKIKSLISNSYLPPNSNLASPNFNYLGSREGSRE